jgi:hypothetical protein
MLTFREEIQRVIDGRTGDRREILPNDGPHVVGGGMLLGPKNILSKSDALCRWLDIALFENLYDVRVHIENLSL